MNTDHKGIFISFEGIDGCGKTTQAKLLKEFLEEQQQPVILTHEPGATELGIDLRKILLEQDIDAYSELLLFLADRREHLQKIVLPALKQGVIVICDRFHDSTIAYQQYGRQLDLSLIEPLVKGWFLQPDCTLFLDISLEQAQQRLEMRQEPNNRFDQESQDFVQRLMTGYRTLALQNPKRIHTVDGSLQKCDIFTKILTVLQHFNIYGHYS